PTTRTGRRVDIRVPDVDAALVNLLTAVIAPTPKLDGMSPIAPIVAALPAAIDPKTLPRTATESLAPLGTMGLFDVDPGSAAYGKRVPFDALLRDEKFASVADSHVIVVFLSR